MLARIGKVRPAFYLSIFMVLMVLAAAAQQPAQPKQDIPDAPSAVQPPPSFPSTPPAEPSVPPSSAPPSTNAPAEPAPSPDQGQPTPLAPPPQGDEAAQPPPMKITTVPEGGATQDQQQPGAQTDLYKIVTNVNQVIVPVRVTDESGHLVNGLLARDFSVFEDSKKQNMNFFTSDPFALSAAVILDLGMPDVAVQKVNQTFPSLEAAFSQFDEISVYTYSNTVGQLTDFSNAGRRLDAALNDLRTKHGENNGVPVTSGPLGPQGPSVNGVPVDPSTPHVITPEKTGRVLNDAVLEAARDLSKRDKTRRKIIFVISDGKEYRSNASYADVLKVLLSNNIMVYGIAVEGSAIPGYNKIERLHLPKMGYSDILPKYANATGGEILNEYSKNSIEGVYQRVIGDARNQYTLGYTTRAVPGTVYHEIEVRVDRPGCKTALRPCVNVYAREGYYQLPTRP